ncbi:MAG TPA: HAD family phosphatase [Oscillospiraceae bacterium]|nr:HAD family phosphatase [Oscillospiraceae bacterium]
MVPEYRYKYVLFDFDGVIADTEESNARYLEKALNFYQIKLTDADRRKLIGTSDQSCLMDLLKKADADVSLEQLQARRRQIGNTYENGDIGPFPGVVHYITQLRESGRKTALVTSTSTRLIITILNRMHMTNLFDVIMCGDMCQTSKPDPTIYLKAMAFLGASPQDCLVIEDSEVGIRAGKNAGATVLAFHGSNVTQDTHEADYQADTYDAVCQLNL